jgi:hypothetical protein
MASSTMGMKFLPLNIVDNLFKKLCISYAKDDKTIFKILEPWYDDINKLIKCAYLSVDMMKVVLYLFRQESKSSSYKI